MGRVISFSFLFIEIYLARGSAFTDLSACACRGRTALLLMLPHFPSDVVRMLTVMFFFPLHSFCVFLRCLAGLLQFFFKPKLLVSVNLFSFFLSCLACSPRIPPLDPQHTYFITEHILIKITNKMTVISGV